MMVVTIKRTSSDGNPVGSYAVGVDLLHERFKGWRELLRKVADEAVEVTL